MTFQEALREAFELGVEFQEHLDCQESEKQRQGLYRYVEDDLARIKEEMEQG